MVWVEVQIEDGESGYEYWAMMSSIGASGFNAFSKINRDFESLRVIIEGVGKDFSDFLGSKVDFCFNQASPFWDQAIEGSQFIGGGTDLLIVARACQSPHFVEMSGMKSIFKPRLPIQIYSICQN